MAGGAQPGGGFVSGSASSNAAAVARALDRAAGRTLPAVETAMRHSAKALTYRVQRNASGRPGPRVITGRYRASWRSEVFRDGRTVVGVVGTGAPQARRLEFGFVGVDSLGRRYNQPPFPHVGPAVEAIGPVLVREFGDALRRSL
ncbi:HK97 gp10 family phage protein [Streptomyces bacillaris]|uniref:HK97 gp10 family phage protein n=1 Tax=Streptomyces bacillaris TaxID=68179 RepID=UPI003D730B3A